MPQFLPLPVPAGWSRVGGDYTTTYYRFTLHAQRTIIRLGIVAYTVIIIIN